MQRAVGGTAKTSLVNMRAMVELLRETFSEWREDNAPRLGAALAYYTVFSLAPLLIIVVAIAGLAFGQAAARDMIAAQIEGLVGEEAAALIQTMVENASRPREGMLATAIGIVTLLFGSLGVYGQLQNALNTIWEVAPKPGRNWKDTVRARLAPAGLVLGTGFLLLVSLVLSAGVSAVGSLLADRLAYLSWLMQIVNFVLTFAVITLLFAMIFRYLPDAKIAWRDVWLGAALTALLFNLGKWAIGQYLGAGGVATAYGAAGSLIVVLLWVYYSAQILFFGAEFTQVYANRHGSRIRPADNAIAVTEEARAQQGIPHARRHVRPARR